ncbi:hypothetical protein KP509_1Z188400 [Ceratopteris richardii]|nr:hypothetical protein KP509_1Z188400 [Ceratopteris richardii]
MDVVGYLYTGLASLIGITRLRKYISSWRVVEEVLFYLYDLKWEINTGIQGNKESSSASKKSPQESRREVSSTSFLINDIGWSMPQPAYNRGKAGNVERNIKHFNRSLEVHLNSSPQAWNWLPVSEDDWESGEYLNRPGLIFNAAKEERPWKVKTNISHGWRAHSGTLRALAVSDGETAVFTAGAGAKMRGLVRKWDISTLQLEMEYTGHIEVVNDICAIPWTQKVASCDGSIHLWNAQTSKCITVFSESSRSPVGCSSSVLVQNNGLPNTSTSVNTEMAIPSGMLFTELHINHYTCMHLIEREQRLVAGTGSGHLRFFDLNSGQQLHLWKCDSDPSDSFLVSAITCTGKYTSRNTGCAEQLFSVAIGSGMGLCRLFDLRAGYSVASWKAHEGFITKLSTFNEYYLVSSSLDKTLCLWDIRRNGAAGKIQTFHGHKHGVSSFEIWGNSLLSSAGTRIGISTITLSASQDQELSFYKIAQTLFFRIIKFGIVIKYHNNKYSPLFEVSTYWQ